MLRGTYFAIHTYKHTGDIPTSSISEWYFPPSGTVDISLFVYKSFAVMLSTSSNWTAESEEAVFAPHAFSNYAEPVHVCHISEGREEKGRAEK